MKYGPQVMDTLVNVSKNLMSVYDTLIKTANTLDEPERTFCQGAAESVFQAMQGGRHNLGQVMTFVQERTRPKLVAQNEVSKE